MHRKICIECLLSLWWRTYGSHLWNRLLNKFISLSFILAMFLAMLSNLFYVHLISSVWCTIPSDIFFTSFEYILLLSCLLTILLIYQGVCKKGSYLDMKRSTCMLCPKGSYQPTDGSTSSTGCIRCPSVYSTWSQGAINLTDCSGRTHIQLYPHDLTNMIPIVY